MLRTYSELLTIPTYEERFDYLNLNGVVGKDTFGFNRYLNQAFYQSEEWKRLRNHIIVRDSGCDMAMDDHEIKGSIYIHHLNPITVEDVLNRSLDIINPEFLVCVSYNTHNAIHYGDKELLPKGPTVRTPNDTCPWK